jgi:hypothetical protein
VCRKDADALRTHLQSEAVNTIFRSDNVRRMVAERQMAGPWIATDPKVVITDCPF